MKKLILALALLLVPSCALAQGKTKAQISADINANLPDNTSGAITPAILRSTIQELVNSYIDTLSPSQCAQFQTFVASVTGVPTCGLVTNASFPTMVAASFKGNPTAVTATTQDFPFTGLNLKGSPNATLDFVLGFDSSNGTIVRFTPQGIAGSITAGVGSIGGLTGTILLGQGLTTSGGNTVLVTQGVPTNTRNAQTSNYTVQTTDCGKTLALGGAAFFTVTFPAAAGFPAQCSIDLVNEDTGRWKNINATASGPPVFSLYPLAAGTVKNQNNVWYAQGFPLRWNTPNAVNMNVDASSGQDFVGGVSSNGTKDCQGTGANACQTLQHAGNVLYGNTDGANNVNTPTVTLLTDITEDVLFFGEMTGYHGFRVLAGSHNWTCTSACLNITDRAVVNVSSAVFLGAGAALSCSQVGGSDFNGVTLKNTGSFGSQMDASHCYINMTNTTVDGSGGMITSTVNMHEQTFLNVSGTFTGVNTPTYSNAVVVSASNAVVAFGNATPSGTFSGIKYNCSQNSTITGSANIPGTTVGTRASGCSVDGQDGPFLSVNLSGAPQSCTSPCTINFDTVAIDTGSYWQAGSHNYKPLVSGTYRVCASARIDATFTAGQASSVAINKNAAQQSQMQLLAQASVSALGGGVACAFVTMNGSTDTISAQGISSGTTPSVLANAALTYMNVQRIGP